MGIKTYPGYTLIGADCGFHFAIGCTPKKLYASFHGIHKNPLSAVPIGRIGNGIYRLEQVIGHPCWWEHDSDNAYCQYQITAIGSGVILNDGVVEDHFAGTSGVQGQFGFSNLFVHPAPIIGGYCAISTRIPTNPIPSLQVTAESFNFLEDPALLAEFFPVDDVIQVHKFCRKSDKTNIKIRFNPS